MPQQHHLLPLPQNRACIEPDPHHHRNHHSHNPQDRKYDAPTLQSVLPSIFDLLKCIQQHITNDLPQPESCKPGAEAWRLFGLGVPSAAAEHRRGRDGGFKDAEENALAKFDGEEIE